ncbi:orotidine-5'-phosphate decarboxylase [Lishizhenia tianjinensis]|uniref:Orotidine-5'-phosphate decarboxylase n=1 Tax=Lishizhenia tianjinensis TaxID=477690 RepID=A0A1I7BM81_9FLAO|nr:orotidine-5'-phosphate decarboxylase [Lishizhenia tianjinensis]SFT88191.1 orotidine-5'-phosphate decarboxylase [Lishizhenia tianjinensis]
MKKEELVAEIKRKQSFLCVGLDTDLNKIPKHLLDTEDPIFEFNKQIIDATKDYCVAYKPNIAFYECLGKKGWESLEKTMEYIPENIFTIADAKRGDIGNTSSYYAKTFFEYLNFDSVTVAPYMGEDSVTPFLQFEDKWVIVLALTSNAGALDFQFVKDAQGEELYKKVLRKTSEWGTPENLMYVVGATRAEGIGEVRKTVPNNFFLVPGVGAQGGSLEDVAQYGFNEDCGLLVNSSRGIIYAGQGEDFAQKAAEAAQAIQQDMHKILQAKGW